MQTVIDFVAEVGQERCHVRVAGDESILFDTVIGLVVSCLALSNIPGKRRKQCRRITLLDKIPKAEQPCGAAIAIKIGVIVCKGKVQDRRLVQFVDAVFSIDEIDQSFHGIRELLRRKSLPAFFAVYNIDNIVAVEMVRQQTVFIRQIVAGADLVQLMQIFFCDRILAVGNEVQTTLHAIDPGFFFIARGVAIQDMPDAVA